MIKRIYALVLTAILMTFSTLNTFAMPFNPEAYTSENEISAILPPNVRQDEVREWAKKRGDFFASAFLRIEDSGNGVIEGLAVGETRFPVDEAYITIYLDKLNQGTGRWKQIAYYEAEFLASDYPDGVQSPGLSAKFTGLEIGGQYRLRGVFAAVYNGEFEGFSPTTGTITLE